VETTALFDRRTAWGDRPGTHALIVGVSSYRNLPSHASSIRDPKFGLRGVASSALSAYRVAQWLIQHADELAVPLVTLSLMIAPSDRETEVEPVLAAKALPCGVDDFFRAANEWRNLARDNRNSSMIFYFSGLGKELARSEPILLFEDFGDDYGPLLRGAVSVNNLVYGLSPTDRQPQIARTQLFFIDSSRTSFENVMRYELANPTPVFDAEFLGIDDRCAPVFYASQPGAHAYSIKGQQTLFSAALLECLSGAAAVPAPASSGEDDFPLWEVTVSSLIDGLDEVLTRRRAEKKAEYDRFNVKQEYAVGGVVRDAVIHRLAEPPVVPVQFHINTKAPAGQIRIHIMDDSDNVVWKYDDVVATLSPDGFETQLELSAGYYRAAIWVESTRLTTRTRLVKPPRCDWTVRA
jgi:hypothetical protein